MTGKCVGRITEQDGFIPSKTKIPNSFMTEFSKLEDPRCNRIKLYPLEEILLVAFLCILCGGAGYIDMENFGHLKIDFLKKFYDFKNGTPSDDTFRRFFTDLNTDVFKEIFVKWAQSLASSTGSRVIAIDGKASRHSFDNKTDTKMLHTVSAYGSQTNLVFGQEKVDEKSNEITAIPKLLDVIDIKGAVITIDAMGCQFLIADLILKKGGNYIFSLKGNQEKLHDDIILYLNDPAVELKTHTTYDKGHGRIETRTCKISSEVKWLHDIHPKWKSIKTIIQINSIRDIEGKISNEDRYYISSQLGTAEELLGIIQQHWGIENCLHWVLDVTFLEDQSRIRKGSGPFSMTMMRHAALNLLQKAKPDRQSIRSCIKMCALSEEMLLSVLTEK